MSAEHSADTAAYRWKRVQAGYYTTTIKGVEWSINGPAGTLADGLRFGKYRIFAGHTPMAWAETLAEAKAKAVELMQHNDGSPAGPVTEGYTSEPPALPGDAPGPTGDLNDGEAGG